MARGPAYPYVDLEQAVEFARKMYQYTRRSSADANAVIREAWNYSPTSSSSGKLVAALKYFGLIEESAGAEGRLIRLSDRAYRILVDDVKSSERRQALHDAVLSPKAYQLCWTKWGRDLPQSMRSNLIFGEGFIESTVDGFLADYKKSIEYAGLLDDEEPSRTEYPEESEVAKTTTSTLGESDDSLHSAIHTPALPAIQSAVYRSDVFSLSEGTVSLTWPKVLSKESFEDLSDWLDLLKRKIERTVLKE